MIDKPLDARLAYRLVYPLRNSRWMPGSPTDWFILCAIAGSLRIT